MTSLDLSRRLSFLCVRFTFGAPDLPTVLTVTSAAGDQTARGELYVSEPAMAVSLDMQGGGVEDKNFKVLLPTNRPEQPAVNWFAKAMASLEPFPPVRALVFEVNSSFDGQKVDIVYLAEGEILNSRSNPDGKDSIVEMEFIPSKSNCKNIKLGIPANPTCAWGFGQAGCLKDNTIFHDSSSYFPNHFEVVAGYGSRPKIRRCYVELTTASGSRRQLVQLFLSRTAHAGASNNTLLQLPQGWWIGSYLMNNGLAIPIRDWWYNATTQSGTNTFVLGKIPPASWLYSLSLDNKILLVPGCNKTKTSCDARANLSKFGGFGYAIPAYNPLVDDATR